MATGGAYRIVAAAILLAAAGGALANSGGISGRSVTGCTGCHTASTYTGYVARINGASGGSSTVAPSSSTAFSTSTTHSGTAAPKAGFNLSVNIGSLTQGGDSQVLSGELTHTSPGKLTSGGDVSWSFTYNAPATVGTGSMFVCTNPVNNAGDGAAGDGPSDCNVHSITVNTTPNSIADSFTVLEDSSNNTFNVLANDTSGSAVNENGDTKEATHINGASVASVCATMVTVSNGTVCRSSSNANNTLQFTPTANFFGATSFTYQITDSLGAISSADTVSITVTAVNDQPTLNAIANPTAINEDASLQTVNLSGISAGSGESQTLTVTASSGNTAVIPNPTVSYTSPNATGSVSYTPVANASGSAVITVTVTDNGGTANGGVNTISRTFTATVNAVNDAPNAVNDTAGIAKNSSNNTIVVLTNDSDIDSAGLTITGVTMPSNGGSVSIQGSAPNQTLNYTPATNYSGPETFDYTISDGALTDTATVTVTVSTGSAPVAVADSATVNEDSSANTIDVLANDTDADVNDTLTVTQVNGSGAFPVTVTHGTVSRSSSSPGNTLLYTPVANYAGPDSFNYTVQDAAGLTAAATVSVTVTNVADTPVAVADSQTVAEDAAPVSVNVLANDTDADQTSGPGDTKRIISVGAASSGGSVTIMGSGVNNTLSYDSALNFFGTETFSYTMEDSTGLQSSATVTMTVTAVNDAPQITSSAITTAQDGVPYSYPVAVSDPDDLNNGVQLAWSLTTAPPGMTVSSTGVIQWTPPVNVAMGYNVTVRVADGGENGAAAATQSFTINVSVPDADGDGMPDSFENQYGFDPNDPGDAAQDADGDGLSNLEEYQQGLDPTLDDVAPVLSVPADLIVPATGYLTVVDLGTATATDGKDGAITPVTDWTFPVVRPGRYVVNWSATDQAGNVAAGTQDVDVLPMADFNVSQVTGEGQSVTVTVTLNGDPPQLPATVNYSVGGSAGAGDSDAGNGGSFVFAAPGLTTLSASVAITADGTGEAAETLVFSMTGASQAVIGMRDTHTITITEANVPPVVSLAAAQGALPRLVAYQGDGTFTISADALDPNGTPVTYNWSGSANALGIDGQTTAAASFDASTVPAGAYPVSVIVSDGVNQTTATLLVIVVAGTSADVDVDADGIPDSIDSVTDYPALLEDQAGNPATAERLETEPGLSLRRGRTSLAAGRTGALIAMSDIVTFGIGNGGLPLGADSLDNLGGIFDFEIHGVATGGNARVVLPLQTAIREGAVYRKFDPASGWHDFVENASNAVASAFSSFGQCPGPASDEYVDGLQPFADCMRLTLADGGPNDADATADGVIRDPSGVAIADDTVDEGGSSVSSGAWLALWLPLALLVRLRRRLGLAVLALVALLTGAPAQAEHHIRIHYSGDLASGFDNNVTTAQHDADIRESGFASAGGNVDYFRQLNLFTTLQVRGSAQGEYWNSFEGLNNGKATGMARVLYKADGAFYTPTLAAWLSASLWEFDSAIRDSNEYRFGVFAIEQLTTQLTGRLALTANRRESDGLVFDLSGYSASINVDWTPAPRSTVYGTWQFYDGGVTSTATPSLAVGLAAEAIEPDDAFGGLAGGLRAYRLDATAHIFTLGYNFAITRKLSADVQGQYVATSADYGIEYQRAVGVVSLLARF